MEAVCFLGMLLYTENTTWRNYTEYRLLYSHRTENVKPCLLPAVGIPGVSVCHPAQVRVIGHTPQGVTVSLQHEAGTSRSKGSDCHSPPLGSRGKWKPSLVGRQILNGRSLIRRNLLFLDGGSYGSREKGSIKRRLTGLFLPAREKYLKKREHLISGSGQMQTCIRAYMQCTVSCADQDSSNCGTSTMIYTPITLMLYTVLVRKNRRIQI